MNAVVSGLAETLKNAVASLPSPPDPNPWDYIPYGPGGVPSWFFFGGGGVGHSGSLCGVPNGCCLVLNMIGLQGFSARVMNYYSNTEFPTSAVCDLYDLITDDGLYPEAWPYTVPIPDDEVLAHVVSNSPLCHISISKWAYEAGVLISKKHEDGRGLKADRCGKITADMAAFTAGLINDALAGVSPPDQPESELTAHCNTCHNTSASSVFPSQQGKMDCAGCHTEPVTIGAGHPDKKKKGKN